MINHVSWVIRFWPNNSADTCEFFWTSRYVEMPVPAGQLVATSQVPTQIATNISANIADPFINGTNQGASGHPTCHEWVWFQLEGKAGCNLGPAQTQCRLIALVIHQELRVLPLKVQWLSYWDMLREFDSTVDVEWVAQKLLRMEWWIRAPCHLECIPCSNRYFGSLVG